MYIWISNAKYQLELICGSHKFVWMMINPINYKHSLFRSLPFSFLRLLESFFFVCFLLLSSFSYMFRSFMLLYCRFVSYAHQRFVETRCIICWLLIINEEKKNNNNNHKLNNYLHKSVVIADFYFRLLFATYIYSVCNNADDEKSIANSIFLCKVASHVVWAENWIIFSVTYFIGTAFFFHFFLCWMINCVCVCVIATRQIRFHWLLIWTRDLWN